MSHHPHHPHHPGADEHTLWSLEGRLQQLVYSPKGGIEGLLIDTDGIPTQFVIDPYDAFAVGTLIGLRAGQALVVEGRKTRPSPKGEGEHVVYQFARLVAVDGEERGAPPHSATVQGVVARLNFARHGAANGVVLDNGDFVHTGPRGMAQLQLQVGEKVLVQGTAHPLIVGTGRVIEARSVNGVLLGPGR